MEFTCLVVDDDKSSVKILTKLIEMTGEVVLKDVAYNAFDARNLLSGSKYDIVFLDVEMPGMTGMQLIDVMDNMPYIILVTSKKEYAVDAFKYNVTDYLLKPVEPQRFIQAINKVKHQQNKTTGSGKSNQNSEAQPDEKENVIFVKEGHHLSKVIENNIQYIEAFGDYVNIITDDKKHTVHSTMKSMVKKLNPEKFIRIHRSYITRLDQIESIEDNMILLSNGTKLPLGGSYKESLMEKLKFL